MTRSFPVRQTRWPLTPLAAACLSGFTALPALAQDAGPGQPDPATPQQSSVQRVEVIARQGANDLRRAASVAKQIYGREELDRFGDTNVLDVMRRLPGVNVGAGGPRMRGLGAGYTQILINGDPAPQGFALDQLSPSQIERIEVLRAPTADQSAQAIAGTINIILKDAPRRSQRDLRLGLADGADRPMANVNLNLGESKGPLSASLPLSVFEWHRENRITLDRQMPGTDGLPAQSQQLGAQEVWGHGLNLGPRLNWKISDDQSVSLQTFGQKGWWHNRTDYDNRVLSGRPVLDDNTAQQGTWQNLRGNVVWNNRFRDDQRLELRGGVQSSRWTFDVRNLRQGAEALRAVGGGRDEGLTQAGKYSRLLGQAHSVTAGWDLEARDREEQRTVTQNGVPLLPDFEGQPFEARVLRQAFYVQDEWEISPQWQMYLGLRHERIHTESRGTGAPVINTSRVLSPLWHVTWKLDPKGRDMIRASLTRSYKAPNLGTLLARPSINASYTDTTAPNTLLSPDRVGNPALRPELATGLDIAFEKYLPGGGLWSVGVFHRSITDLVRTVTTLQPVAWASVPRWVAQPQNFSSATTSGLELEVKGRAAELLPSLLPEAKALNLRASLNLYRSRVAALPGPDNRLDGQQPWSATLGFDQRISGLPLNLGGSFSLTPAYDTQVTADQLQQRSRGRSIDLFAQWIFRPGLSMRVATAYGSQPFGPSNGSQRTLLANGDFTQVDRQTRPQFNVSLDVRL
ncbi:MAG: TonB-dependent receptor [Rubrivivax sp.]|nr:TonB-dependent receptor [Rubrivivax sp.]